MLQSVSGAELREESFQSAVDRVAMGGPIRLDLGCGHKQEDGWVRVDFAVERRKCTTKGGVTEQGAALDPDVATDLRALPFPDDYADAARAIHVIEHFQVWEAPKVIREWVRVLKPGAELAIECPCLDKIVQLFNVPNIPPWATFWGLYGDPRLEDPLMMHHWCYTENQLRRLMESCGLAEVHGEPPRFHQQIRDMRMVGYKPIPESRIELAH
jgi:SAM-dependent methyltransferase